MSRVGDALEEWTAAAGALRWERPWDELYEGEEPPGRWFVGGRLAAAANLLDRHLLQRATAPAIVWEGEPGDRRLLTYAELHCEAQRLAAALHGLGLRTGDRVALHLGAIPELVVAMVACAHLGVTHSLIPVPLPVEAISERLAAVRPKVVITQDEAWRHGGRIPTKRRSDDAMAAMHDERIQTQVVVRRTGEVSESYPGDVWYDELVAAAEPGEAPGPAAVDADHPLLIDFVRQGLPRPTAIVARTAGLLLMAAECHRRALTREDGDVFWCAMEPNAISTLTHGIYGPLLSGSTVLLMEGTALGTTSAPDCRRVWEFFRRNEVDAVLALAPAIRRYRTWAEKNGAERLPRLRLAVSAGAPLDDQTATWVGQELGAADLLLCDAWGQAELGGVAMITPSPRPSGGLPDIGAAVVDAEGRLVEGHETGEFVLRNPWPGTFVAIDGHPDPQVRYWRYWSRHPGWYATDDLVRWTPDGRVEFIGRADSTVKIGGQLVTLEGIDGVLGEHPLVADAIVASVAGEEGEPELVAWVVTAPGMETDQVVAEDVQRYVGEWLGGLARPARVGFAPWFPSDLCRGALRLALGELALKKPGRVIRATEEDLRGLS